MPSLRAIISADASPMARELKAIERLANQTGTNIKSGLDGGTSHMRTGPIRETMVLLREMGRGNWSRVPGSLSILMGQLGLLKLIVKDNAKEAQILADAFAQKAAKSLLAARAAKEQAEASTAAFGAMRTATAGTILAVKADQDKAVAALAEAEADRVKAISARQAAVAMEAEGIAARFAMGPIGWVALGLAAVATAAYLLTSHYRRLAAEEKNLQDLMDVGTGKFSDRAAALKHAGGEMADYLAWLRKISDSEYDVADATSETLKAMREKAKYQRELAEAGGASKSDIAKMEIAEAKRELEIVNAAKAEAQRQVMKDKVSAGNAELSANDPARAEQIKLLGEKSGFADRVADAAQAAMKAAGTVSTGELDLEAMKNIRSVGGPAAPIFKSRAVNENDKLTFKVDDKEFFLSFAEAKKVADDITAEENKLAATQKQLNDLLAEKKKLTEKDVARVKTLEKESAELSADLKNKSEFLPQIASKEDNGNLKMVHGHVNSLQQVGAYAQAASTVHHISSLHETVKQISRKLDKHDKHNPPPMGGVKY